MNDPAPALEQALAVALRTLAARKAEHLVALDLREMSSFTDFFVICHGNSDRQVKSLVEEVLEKVKEQTGRRATVEGLASADWVLLDYGDFVVHVFSAEARDFYRLERLWGDAGQLDLRPVTRQAAVADDQRR